jgi:hypothetical protein
LERVEPTSGATLGEKAQLIQISLPFLISPREGARVQN